MGEYRMNNVLLGYLSKDVVKTKILDSDLLVIAKAKEGDKEAIKKLIDSNIKLVVKFASNFRVQNDIFMDLIGEGCLGIMKAIKKYDPSRGVKFSSYAGIWIKHCMLKFLAEQSLLKVPLRKKKVLKNLIFCENVDSLIRESDVNLEKYLEISLIGNVVFTSDLNYFDSVEFSYSAKDIEHFIEEEYLSSIVKEKVLRLSPKERFVIEHRFGLNGKSEKSLNEIARMLGTSPEGVRYVEQRALKKLKRMIQSEKVI